jgi:hypothetical protein
LWKASKKNPVTSAKPALHLPLGSDHGQFGDCSELRAEGPSVSPGREINADRGAVILVNASQIMLLLFSSRQVDNLNTPR